MVMCCRIKNRRSVLRLLASGVLLLNFQCLGAAQFEDQPMELRVDRAPVKVQDSQMKYYRNYATVEKALVRRVCKLTAEQEQSLETIDDRWLETIHKENLNEPKPLGAGLPQQLGRRAVMLRPRSVYAMLEFVANEIEEQIKTFLDADQSKAFQDELAARAEFRRQANAAVFVAIIDQHVYLRDEQRERLQKLIAENPEIEKQAWKMFVSNRNWFPAISNLESVLDPAQIAALPVWNKVSFPAIQFDLQSVNERNHKTIER